MFELIIGHGFHSQSVGHCWRVTVDLRQELPVIIDSATSKQTTMNYYQIHDNYYLTTINHHLGFRGFPPWLP